MKKCFLWSVLKYFCNWSSELRGLTEDVPVSAVLTNYVNSIFSSSEVQSELAGEDEIIWEIIHFIIHLHFI